MEETGCHIHFPDSNRTSAVEKSNQVSIAGDMERVERARARVRVSNTSMNNQLYCLNNRDVQPTSNKETTERNLMVFMGPNEKRIIKIGSTGPDFWIQKKKKLQRN